MPRKFGIELELVGCDTVRALEILRSVPGLNISQDTHYRHGQVNVWKIVPDSSVTDNRGNRGFEIVSPVLVYGHRDHYTQIQNILKVFTEAGCYVNTTCGFHVHFEARDLTAAQLRFIAYRYSKFESDFDSFMPVRRRDNRNQYCLSMKTALEVFNEGGYGLMDYWYSDRPEFVTNALNNKYLKVNLSAYQRHRTIEFRQHSGTLDYNKIMNWVEFLHGFIATSVTKTPTNYSVCMDENTAPRQLRAGDITMPNSVLAVRHNRVVYCYMSAAEEQVLLKLLENPGVVVRKANLANRWCLESQLSNVISKLRRNYNLVIKCQRNVGYKLQGMKIAASNRNYCDAWGRTEAPVNRNAILNAINERLETDVLWDGIPRHIQSFYTERAIELQQTV